MKIPQHHFEINAAFVKYQRII